MITKFKLFENKYESDDDLVDLFSQDFIEDYYESNFEISGEYASIGINIWDYVDIDRFREGTIKDTVDNTSIADDEFSFINYAEYIENNILNEAKPELDKFRKKYNLGGIKYADILYKMDRMDLIKLIEKLHKEKEFMAIYYEDKWEELLPEEILEELWGKQSSYDIYQYVSGYVDDNKLIDEYMRRVDFTEKYEFARDSISTDINLQRKLLEIDTDTVIQLEEIMYVDDNDENEDKNIAREYEFQKLFIEKNGNDIAKSVKHLNDRFELNPKIKKEYSEYMYLIDAEKYNL